jgi:predicted TIM-barrel fold metal-dependent hydrolase/ketosteroid isomerase-like protein
MGVIFMKIFQTAMIQFLQKKNQKLSSCFEKKYSMKRIYITAILIGVLMPYACLAQVTGSNAGRGNNNERGQKTARQSSSIPQHPITPLVDHHAHIWSANARAVTLVPTLPVIELPEELARLLRDKERYNGKETNASALADLYTKDALVLNPGSPAWLHGERAMNYVTNSIVIDRLMPTAFQADGSTGFIAGYEASTRGTSLEYVSNFLYAVKKDSDGKWRISAESFTFDGPPAAKEFSARQLIQELDVAGTERGVVLSVAYWFGSRMAPNVADEYSKVQAENDWAADQVSRYPQRLIGFCSFNPLKDYALKELDRCAKSGVFKGLKIHFGMSQVDLKNPDHVRRVQQVFAGANRHRLPIVVHARTNFTTYGREHAEIFVNQILPAAPDVTVQIAHLWGGEAYSEPALTVFADAVSRNHPATKNLYFDVTQMELVLRNQDETVRKKVVSLIRQIGLRRILYGADRPRNSNAASREAWVIFQATFPLTMGELRAIAGNVAPYLRR